MTDKFPCATCEDLPTCEDALKWGGLGMELESEGFPVTEVCITCPKDGVTYKATKFTGATIEEMEKYQEGWEAVKRNTAADPEPGME